MKAKFVISAALLISSVETFAETYQSEVGLRVNREDSDFPVSKYNSYEAFGKYFFKSVETNNLPYAEAAYLGRATNVFAHLYHSPEQNSDPSLNIYTLGAEVYVPEHFLYAAVGGRKMSSEGRDRYDLTTIVGLTPIDGLRVTSTYNSKQDYRVNLQGKYVTDLGNDHFVNVEATFYDGKGYDVLSAGGDYYFDRTFSVGGNITDADGHKSYELRLRKFFSPTFAADVSYHDDDFGNSISAGITARF